MLSCPSLLAMQMASDMWAWKPIFFSSLPMCFFFVGATISNMQREIRTLQQRLAELEKK